MKFEPTSYKTKTDEFITIRTAHEDEAKALRDLKLEIIGGSMTIPMHPEEYKNDETGERDLIKKYNDSSNSILLVAEANHQLIGMIDLTGNERKIMAHTAMIGMSIKEGWRNKGVGTSLIKGVLDWAKSFSDLEVIWLEVYANNELGLGLYKKMGFKISGKIERFFKHKNVYFDNIKMYQLLPKKE